MPPYLSGLRRRAARQRLRQVHLALVRKKRKWRRRPHRALRLARLGPYSHLGPQHPHPSFPRLCRSPQFSAPQRQILVRRSRRLPRRGFLALGRASHTINQPQRKTRRRSVAMSITRQSPVWLSTPVNHLKSCGSRTIRKQTGARAQFSAPHLWSIMQV